MKWNAKQGYELSFKFVCERVQVTRMGPQGLGMVHLGVCPQVYLHLLYLDCKYIEHSRVYVYGITWNTWDKTNETKKPMIYNLFEFFSKG